MPLKPVLFESDQGSVEVNLRPFDLASLAETASLGAITKVDDEHEPVYSGLIIHDLRRSAIKNLMKAGVNEKFAMKISGHKTRDVFDRYHIVDTDDVVNAMRRVQISENGANTVQISPTARRLKELTA
jgi:hypothetical protein